MTCAGAMRGFVGAAVLAGALLAPQAARGQARDAWFGRDKAYHFGASAGLAFGGYGAAALLTDDAGARMAAGLALSLAAGVGKELWDLSGHGDASWRDLTWDAIGAATGVAIAYALDRFVFRRRGERSPATVSRPLTFRPSPPPWRLAWNFGT